MSLLICSSAQEKYTTTGFQVVGDSDILTSTAQAAGIQNPASFTNNINPVLKIPPHSEVALKSASYFKNRMFQIGDNVSYAFYFGQFLRSKYGQTDNLALEDVTNFPIPIPIPKGTYNLRTFANEISLSLDRFISHPDLVNHCWCEPAEAQEDGTNLTGFVWNFQQGDSDSLTNAVTEIQALPATDSAGLTISTMNAWKTDTDEFTWEHTTTTYTSAVTSASIADNCGILEDAPISQKGGRMVWNVASAESGWRIGLTRPTARDGREQPPEFVGVPDEDALTPKPGFYDYVLNYVDGEYVIWHCVEENGSLVMKEVNYYNNTAADFEPALDAGAYGDKYKPMHHAGRRWTDADAADSTPVTVEFKISGEDITISYVDSEAETYVLTDTRLCVVTNPTVAAQTPTRNKFPKPTGLTTHALYPKVQLQGSEEDLVLTIYEAAVKSGSIFYNADYDKGQLYEYPHIVDTSPLTQRLSQTAGSSFYGRSVLAGQMKTRLIAHLVDTAKPYQSGLTALQKQYVGLGGPDANDPPVRINEGDPIIPDPAVEDGLGIAYSINLVLVPSLGGIGANNVRGSYACETSDVSGTFGFPDKTMVGSTRDGSTYLLADALVPGTAAGEPGSAPPTNTLGAFFGWYIGSDSSPVFSRGQMFLRCPQFTHQSQNFGKGIPSKIISQLPPASDLSDGTGEIFYEPSNMTYVSLNNTNELNINVLTLEIVDKTEKLIENLGKSTTIVLHIRHKDKH